MNIRSGLQVRSWLYRAPRRRLLLVVTFLTLFMMYGLAWASGGGEVTILTPLRIGGDSGAGDQRDADIYPAVAYDKVSQRYLVAWQTVRNAGSSSEGMDVYGVFLDNNGQITGDEFRISDDNNVARGSLPKVAAGQGEFVVSWTRRGSQCRVVAQRVINTTNYPDQTLASSSVHNHSPSLMYNPNRQRYILAFVNGDDYLPPQLFGADSDDCGNSAASTSRIQALEFHFTGNTSTVDAQVNVSNPAGGAFRPALAYSTNLHQSIIAWEDRRSGNAQNYRFDVYAQRLNDNISLNGANQALAIGDNYVNDDDSATWTPRPAIAASNDGFLLTWWGQENEEGSKTRLVWGRLVLSSGWPNANFIISRASFAQSHINSAPTGFLALVFDEVAQEYMVGLTSHLESLWGYISSTRIQRITNAGVLLKLDGSIRPSPGVGYAIDYANDDQISLDMAINPTVVNDSTTILTVYGKHAPREHSQDFDVWGTQLQMSIVPTPTPELFLWLPLLKR